MTDCFHVRREVVLAQYGPARECTSCGDLDYDAPEFSGYVVPTIWRSP